ncbi:MAG: sulfurtransferase [Ectothiorhodospiraceae bacterium]|nr:sulfurtransferase [Ectothiorhodospiraceae bacterium]MCH8502885.1 sulfurtransferase [Ectothiorhodospiraceae bacterium]
MSDARLDELPLLMEPDELERLLGIPGLLVVDLSDADSYADHHVPGAVRMDFPHLVRQEPPAMGLLPKEEDLTNIFSGIGLTPDTHVVACDNTGGGRAARLLWTLDVVGHERYSMLNGGIKAWAAEGHPVEAGHNQPSPSRYKVTLPADPESRADMNYLLQRLGSSDLAILDARSPAEYDGSDRRAAKGGHIPGAVNLNWTDMIDADSNGRLKPAGELLDMLRERRVTPDKEVVTHCQTHHRSALTWVALRALGFHKVKGYDGSWSEWGNDPKTPVE